MVLLRILGRVGVVAVGLSLFVLGLVALGVAYWPEVPVARVAGRLALAVGETALEPFGSSDPRAAVAAALDGLTLRFGAAPVGFILAIAALLPGRSRRSGEGAGEGGFAESGDPRKVRKQAAQMAKKGDIVEAAGRCLDAGLFDEAAGYYIDAGEHVRAAEIRHDQERFIESAQLYLEGGQAESAGRLYSQHDEPALAAEAYLKAGDTSIAAEMFEKAGNHASAAECYQEAGFPRHAGQAYTKCGNWEQAAICLEQTIVEEASALGPAGKSAELQKLVRMAGNLFERAGLDERAEAVLVRGECFAAAAEIARQHGRDENAAEFFIKAKDAPRAADVLSGLGRGEEASRLLAEHHRSLGDDEEAARHFDEAHDFLAAGDIYRMLEQYERAGECYEQHGDLGQAAEMFGLAGNLNRAAGCYESAGLYAEAAECTKGEGDERKQTELLSRAGDHLRAGGMHLTAGRQDDAIAAFQQVAPEHEDFAAASAALGDIFLERGEHRVAIAKLRRATGDREITSDTVRAFYGLATALEVEKDITEADALYERILSFDYTFLDVQQRLERTRETLKLQAERSQSPAATPTSGTAEKGRYEIVGTLGRGGMGVVYKAIDSVLDRTVAFKVLPETLKENPQALKNFLREAKSAAKLNHPGIVTVYDAGEQDGNFYIAMEHVEGHTLKDVVKRQGKISSAGIVHVLVQMCEALAYAHDKRVVHRDIKTANAMWTRDRKVKIMDFGLAKVIEEVRNHTTVISGTPYYMSPEQTLGKNVDHRTDIYSLGITAFEMAAATLPFREGNLPYHHVHTPPPDVREFNPEISPEIASIIARCLEKSPANRYQSTLEMAKDLKSAARSQPKAVAAKA